MLNIIFRETHLIKQIMEATGEVTPDKPEPVNGKIDLGFKRLVPSHVENACTIYAYVAGDSHLLAEYKAKLSKVCPGLDPLGAEANPKVGEKIYGAFSVRDSSWLRARVEQQAGGGQMRKEQVRVRFVDVGKSDLVNKAGMVELPEDCGPDQMPIKCQRYKMSDLKPKGKDDGFSAKDREFGADWLRSLVSNKPIKAKCHEVVNYKGGLWFEGEIDGKNLNAMALQSGFAIPNPAAINNGNFMVCATKFSLCFCKKIISKVTLR